MSPPALPPDLERRVRARLEAEPSTRPALRRSSAPVVALVAMAVAVAVFTLSRARPDLDVLPRGPFFATLAILGGAAVAFTWVSARRGRFGLGPPIGAVTTIAIVATPLYLLVGVVHPIFTRGVGDVVLSMDRVLSTAAGCGLSSGVIGGCLLAALTLVLRKTSPVIARAQGAALGVSCALFGACVLQVHCPICDRAHLLFGHALPIALLGWIGASLSSRAMEV